MGLMYIFPISDKEDFLIKKHTNGMVSLKTYGLPPIFWFYLVLGWATATFLTIAIYAPLVKMLQGDDSINQILALIVAFSLVITLLTFTSFYFYKKIISKKGTRLTISHRIFGLTLYSKTWHLSTTSPFLIQHHLDSPNMARLNKTKGHEAFQNRGYFEFFGKNTAGKRFFIDRHTRKRDLERLRDYLTSF